MVSEMHEETKKRRRKEKKAARNKTMYINYAGFIYSNSQQLASKSFYEDGNVLNIC